jgi:hypothetical protein
MCSDRTLLMQLKVVPPKRKTTTKVQSSLHGGGAALTGGLRTQRMSFTVTIVPEGFMQKFEFL